MTLDDTIIIYTVEEVAYYLLMNEESVRSLIKKGKLKALYQGSNKKGYLIVSVSLLETILDNKKYKKTYDLLKNTKKYGNRTTARQFILELLYQDPNVSYTDFCDLMTNMEGNLKRILKNKALLAKRKMIEDLFSQINFIV